MATLQVRDMDDRLYDQLKMSAKIHNRSISQEVITILQEYLNSNQQTTKNATIEFLALTGSWKDERDADEIINDVKRSRQKSERFGENSVLFD